MPASPVAVFAQGDPASEWGTTDINIVDQDEGDVKSKSSHETDAHHSAMQERSLPTVAGSSAKGGALNGEKTSLKGSVTQDGAEVNAQGCSAG